MLHCLLGMHITMAEYVSIYSLTGEGVVWFWDNFLLSVAFLVLSLGFL